MIHARACPLLLAILLSAGPADAQYGVIPSVIGSVVGNMVAEGREADCMRGIPMSPSEIAEARDAAAAVMAQYFTAAQSGATKSSAFHLDKKTVLTVAGRSAGMANLDAATDPLARPGNMLADRPLRFFRSGMDATAIGQWTVRGTNGATAGAYTALLVRKAQVWKLRELVVAVPGEKVAPAMQFCHAPGDVTKYKLQSATFMREQGEKRLAKAQKRLADAARSPIDPTETVRRRNDLSKRASDLARARSLEQQAQDENRKIEQLTVDAAAAQALTSSS